MGLSGSLRFGVLGSGAVRLAPHSRALGTAEIHGDEQVQEAPEGRSGWDETLLSAACEFAKGWMTDGAITCFP